jgi:hypothetical protein
VVRVRELLHPFTITRPNFRAESALQLPAHSIFCSRTQIGDQLRIACYEAREPLQGNGNGNGRTDLDSVPLDFRPSTLYGRDFQIAQQGSTLDSRHPTLP